MIPEELRQAIDVEAAKYDFHTILEAREDLTEKYRSGKSIKTSFMKTEAEICSYLVTRMPATYSVVLSVLQELILRLPTMKIQSLLDLGSGPGTVMWAATELCREPETITLVEKNPSLCTLAKRLAAFNKHPAVKNAVWENADLETYRDIPVHDLVVLSYVVGELPENAMHSLVEAAWKVTGKALVIIEPGTPTGFERIRSLRSQLLTLGAEMIAPCTHAGKCPMTGGDWCHFSCRVERSGLHKKIKKGSLPYEDEKYSYLIVSKSKCPLPRARILRQPQKRSGHINLTLCSELGLTQEVVSKRDPELYKLVKKLEWGSSL